MCHQSQTTTLSHFESQDNALSHLSQWKVGALFMEAGTGKTRVAIDLIEQSPCQHILWICPLRIIDNTKQEMLKWGFNRDVRFVGVESIGQSERIYLETEQWLKDQEQPFIVVDESLKIKNINAKRTKRTLHLGNFAEYKLILNGTPLSKNLLDLYPQMTFLSPLILKMTFMQFKNRYCKIKTVCETYGCRTMWKEFITGYANIDNLMSLIRNYVFEADLTLDVEQNFKLEIAHLTDDSFDAYQAVKSKYLKYETLLEYNNRIFMAMTQEMHHAYCCDSSKIAAVKRIFETEKQEDTIIFCKFVDSHKLCEEYFPKAKVLSYQKESFGLNLQDYSVMIFFDMTFDYALRIQATRRVYRMGQKKDCRYYDIYCDIGLDSMIRRCIHKKMDMLEYFKSKTMKEIMKEL